VKGLVLDCSVAAAWCFEDEASPAADALLERVRDEGAVVPPLWHWEIANVLLMASRKGRLAQGDVSARLTLLGALPIDTDLDCVGRSWRETLLLAQTHHLTAYDAAYLELAQRAGVPLATRDGELATAARAMRVVLAL
jgi:predicted nucleic acid-binding protein